MDVATMFGLAMFSQPPRINAGQREAATAFVFPAAEIVTAVPFDDTLTFRPGTMLTEPVAPFRLVT
jgi:hypothetical protein